jgi:tetrapyrrole methylase family protein/MazG family protein
MSQSFDELVALVTRLRSPDGCPWDKKQTHDSLKPYLVEESYEVLDALDRNNPQELREELGDLFLQVLLHAELEAEEEHFTIHDVITSLHDKLVRRHPHVFGRAEETKPSLDSEQVINQWEQIKQTERIDQGHDDSILKGVPACLPALLRSYQVQKRASRVGFDWKQPEQVVEKLDEELQELREATLCYHAIPDSTSNEQDGHAVQEAIENEFGDVLFTVANLARYLKVNPEEALRKSCNRFVSRFTFMEQQAKKTGQPLQQLTDTEWETLWAAAKQQEQTTTQRPSSSSGQKDDQ